MSTEPNTLEVGGRVMSVSGENLPPELQRIAEQELGETDEGRADALARLNQLLDECPELNSRRDSAFLLRFIRVRKYNVDAALETLKAYYNSRVVCPCMYENFVPSNAKPAARQMYAVLPELDAHGRRVVLIKAGAWTPSLSSYSEAQQAMYLVLDYIAADPSSQTVGLSMILDFEGFSAAKLLSVHYGLLKRGTEFALKCVPYRLKAIHVVRQSYVYDILFSIFRHLVSRKFTERIQLHGTDFEGLHRDVPATILPEEYGGSGPAVDFEAFWSLVDEQEPSFVESNGYGYLETNKKGTRHEEMKKK